MAATGYWLAGMVLWRILVFYIGAMDVIALRTGVVTVVLEMAFPEMVSAVLLGFPWLTVVGLVILAAIFTVGFIGEDSRPQLLSTFTLVALLAVANWLNHRKRDDQSRVESSDDDKQPVLID